MATAFSADLRIPMSETIGPLTNQRSVNLLHPDMCQSSPDLGRARVAQREVDRVAYLPDKLNNNYYMKPSHQLDKDGNLVARTLPDDSLRRTIMQDVVPDVLVTQADAVRAAYMVQTYGHTDSGTVDAPEANKVLFWQNV